MDLLKRNEDYIIQKRLQMKDKAIKNLQAMLGVFDSHFAPDERTPLERERDKILTRRAEYYKNKIQAVSNK